MMQRRKLSPSGGGIIRESEGKLYYIFFYKFESCLTFRVEMKGIKIGLDMIKRVRI